MFRLRLPWTAAPRGRPATAPARRPQQFPRFILSHDRRSANTPAPPDRPAPRSEAPGADCAAAAGDLPDAWMEAAEGAFSANTRRALKADFRIYRAWCAEEGREALPAAPDTIADFVDAMAAARAPATVRRYVASIAAAHRAAGSPEAPRSPEVKLALKRMHRDRGRRQAQAPGLTWPLRRRLVEAAGDRLIDIRNRALLAVAYDTMLRRSELAALRVCDLAVDRTGAATVLVRNSKTDAEGEGATLYVAPDSMALVAEWLERSGVADGRLFRSVDKGGRIGEALDPSQIPRIYKAMARHAGIEPKLAESLSGHSPRVGAAQDMVAYGIELPAIQQTGRWKNPGMVNRYGERLLAARSAAAQLARLQGRDRPVAQPGPLAPADPATLPTAIVPTRTARGAHRRPAVRRAPQYRARPATPPECARREPWLPLAQPNRQLQRQPDRKPPRPAGPDTGTNPLRASDTRAVPSRPDPSAPPTSRAGPEIAPAPRNRVPAPSAACPAHPIENCRIRIDDRSKPAARPPP